METAGLYIHIPFCASKCSYCDFYSKPCDLETKKAYVEALIKNIELTAKNYSDKTFDTLFIGGGTPSYLGDLLERVIDKSLNSFNFPGNSEVTIEANPEFCSKSLISNLKSSGVNRVSIGVQSFNETQLKVLGRIHSVNTAFEAVENILSVGIDNFNLDLMFGIPVLNEKENAVSLWENTVNTALSINPTHISAYSLTLEENTPLYKRMNEYTFPTDNEEDLMYEILCEKLNINGFEHYEISNYAKKGYECKHNLKYWEHKEYLGLGPSAHSFMNGSRFYVPGNVDEFIMGNSQFINYEDIDENEAVYERLMTGLRLKKGIDISILENVYNVKNLVFLLERLCKEKLVNFHNNNLSLTEKGFRVSNLIINEIDKYRIL